ncbi:3-ketoacyl- thiolase peroxisomal [Chlorella sorokiniana]|uniref:3-ketoacyl-thiolase peroxisomal n=1 Tax=Chlorella sorokiniana TaxID=3076 RepID=A0A2P6TUD6_CHLSO|nr:3-ketoacyl- thiolase peroxisomal [Chlorella sorokiniana]|eukprot:PRW57669.1 3-ketoacyl- thiolase peroxisomal [Chlorella sorokiniana]
MLTTTLAPSATLRRPAVTAGACSATSASPLRLPRSSQVCAAAAVDAGLPSARTCSNALHEVVIVSAALVGGFKDTPIDDLVVAVLKETLKRTGVKPNVRTATILAGFPVTVPAMTVNRQCAAGLQSIADAAAGIAAGYYDIAIAGGVESMSHAPLKWEGSENPKLEENEDAKACLTPMGQTSDNVAERFHVPREVQDAAAVASHAKALRAQEAGKFKDEIVPVETIQVIEKDGQQETKQVVIDKDDGIRSDFTMQARAKLQKMRPVFRKGGTTTVGNACQTTDGAACVMLMTRGEAEKRGLPIMATLRSYAAVGVHPSVMGIGPAEAIPKALEKAGLAKDDVEVFEINEAFASQFAYCVQALGIDAEKINPNGGAIALGHPIGCSGARQTVTLLHEMQKRVKGSTEGSTEASTDSHCSHLQIVMAEREPGSSQPSAQDSVLGEVLVNQRSLRSGPEEDPDLALAKMLQAQEQAWLAMAGSGAMENLGPAAGAAGGDVGAAAGATSGGYELGAGAGEPEELTDEEMARRLQEEEEREFQQRLLALAGIGPAPGGGGGVPGEGAAEGEEAEYASEDEVDPDDLSYEELTALGEAVGTVSKGIPAEDIDALPQQAYHEVAGTTAGGEEQCPICRMEFEPEDAVRVLPLCRHYFHPDCVAQWLSINKVCCICNREVLEEGKKDSGAAAEGGGAGGVLGERRR